MKSITKAELKRLALKQRERYLRPRSEKEACLREEAKRTLQMLKDTERETFSYLEVKKLLNAGDCWALYLDY